MTSQSPPVYEDRFGSVIDRAAAGYLKIRRYDTTEDMSKGQPHDWLAGFAGEVQRRRRPGVLVDATRFLIHPAHMDGVWRDPHIIPHYIADGVQGSAFHMPDGLPTIGAPPQPEGPASFRTAYFGRGRTPWMGSAHWVRPEVGHLDG